jgi:NarL family two-component system response regulator YdfI
MTKRNGGGVIRVLLAAASTVRRAGLEALIKKAPQLQLSASLQGSLAVAQYASQLQPDVLLLDLDNEGRSLNSPTSPALPRIPTSFPAVALIDEPLADWTAYALRSGVKAILPRDSGMEEILAAIHAAHAGLVLLDPDVIQDLVSRVPAPAAPREVGFDELTSREIEVLRMLADGSGNREIASRLGISDHTVKFHISSILDKLGAATRTEAVTLGIRMGIILL